MDDELLVRTYKVGFGDCIYARIPDGDGAFFHLMIDCGTSSSGQVLEPVLKNVYSMLTEREGNERRLDLLVVTHPHADHIKGFNPEWLKRFRIKRIWLPVFMKPDHPQAAKARALENLAESCALALMQCGFALSPATQERLARITWNICNPEALKALRVDLAQASGIHPTYPLYVARDLAERLARERWGDYDIDQDQNTTCFHGFRDRNTCLRVLAPEWDIDRFYLGRDTLVDGPLLEPGSVHPGVRGVAAETPGKAGLPSMQATTVAAVDALPENISGRDFRILCDRLSHIALAFSQEDNSLKNNTCVVLLLEWRGRRLLFAGDAEWQGNGVEEARRNSTWDVMLSLPEVSRLLLQPLDFLKVAHHGSHNGTPFGTAGKGVLDQMVRPERTHAVVSTVRGKHGDEFPVPFPDLMEALGQRATNARKYSLAKKEDLPDKAQPQRTDLETREDGEPAPWVDVTIPPYPA